MLSGDQVASPASPLPLLPRLAFLLGVFDEQPADEVLGQLAGVAEVFLVEVVVHGRDVGQGLLLRLTQERGGAAQTGRQTQGSASPALTPCHLGGQTQKQADAGPWAPRHTRIPRNLPQSASGLPPESTRTSHPATDGHRRGDQSL